MCWPAFGRILVLVAAFSCSTFNWNSIENMIFPAFGKILVLAAAFYCFIFESIYKLFFPALVRMLVLAAAFSCTSAQKMLLHTNVFHILGVRMMFHIHTP